MAYIVLPQQQREKTGQELFAEGFSPGLQKAIDIYLQKQIQDMQTKRAYQQAQQMGMVSPNAQQPGGYALNQGTSVSFDGGVPKFSYNPATNSMMPVFVTSPTGELTPSGSVPKGSRVLTPSQLETPAQKQQRDIETAKEKSTLPTADMKNLLLQTQSQIENVRMLRKEAESLPGGWQGGFMAMGKGLIERKGEVLRYMRKVPAVSAGLYRALTGDNRLSDADAAARAKPLVWDPTLDPSEKKPMFDSLEKAFEARAKILQSGNYAVDPETQQPIIPLEQIMETMSGPQTSINVGRFKVEVE